MKKQIFDGGCTFSCTPTDGNQNANTMFPSGPGMTLRDWFAGMVAAEIYANRSDLKYSDEETIGQGVARNAYGLADAMLAERSHQPIK